MPGVAHKPLRTSLAADVLVIGAGISGALVAESLADAGLKVVVVDRRAPGKGSTSASTALLQYELDVPLTRLSRALGVTKAETIWRRSRLALDALRDRSLRLGIQADLCRRDALYLAGDKLDRRGLEREAEARRRAGFEVSLLTRQELRERYGIRRAAALLSSENMTANPRKLAAGYLRWAQTRGARVFAPCEVVDVRESARQVLATTNTGHEICVSQVVFATGYELAARIRATGHSIASTWAIATRPQRAALWPSECMIWEASEPYLYLRTTPDGRIICGGEDEPFADESKRDALLPRKTKTLEAKLKRLFPEVDARAEFRWTGSFGASATGTPSIGRIPRARRQFAVLGYGGNGITFSMLAAQLLRGLITGVGDADAELFKLSD